MNKSIGRTITMTLVGAIIIGGANIISATTNKKTQAKDNVLLTSKEEENNVSIRGGEEAKRIIANIQEIQKVLNENTDVSIEEQKEMTIYLLENLPTLIEAHAPKIGDTTEDLGVWLELKQANSDLEQFQLYLDTIDLDKYQPMSEQELNTLIEE